MGGERFGLGDRVRWIMKKRQKEFGGEWDFVIAPWVAWLGIRQALAQRC